MKYYLDIFRPDTNNDSQYIFQYYKIRDNGDRLKPIWSLEKIKKNILNEMLNSIQNRFSTIAKITRKNKEEQESRIELLKGECTALFENIVPPWVRKELEGLEDGTLLCISSQDDNIPWEILHDNNGFLGDRLRIYNNPLIYIGGDIERNEKLTYGKNFLRNNINIIGGSIENSKNSEIDREVKIKKIMDGVKILEPFLSNCEKCDGSTFLQLIECSKINDLINFTCHGKPNPLILQISKNSSVADNLSINSLSNSKITFLHHSLIILNACHSARPVFIFGDFNSFAHKFYEKRAGVVIGSRGVLRTNFAIEFINKFYQNLIAQNGMIFDSFISTKKQFCKENQILQILYSIYGHYKYLFEPRLFIKIE